MSNSSSLLDRRMATRRIEISEILKDAATKLVRDRSHGTQSVSNGQAKIFTAMVRVAPGANALLLVLIRVLVRMRLERLALSLVRLGAPRDDNRARVHWEKAKLLLRIRRTCAWPYASSTDQKELISALDAASRSQEFRIRAAAEVALGEALYQSSQYPQAIAAAEQGLSNIPNQMRLLRVKANSLIALRHFDEGRAVYDEMLAHQPASAPLIRTRQFIEPLSGRPDANIGPHNAPASLLIAVGGGIGDLLHVTPVIRNIARRSGERIEVIARGDHPGSEFLVHNSDYVARVVIPSPKLMNRRYKAVLLTHSFGSIRLPFNADRIWDSHEWRTFRPGEMHETVFNLEVAKHLLGIEYDEGDATEYFVGDLKYHPPASPLIGIHAGSKAGRWLSKRWPYFRELAVELSARGLPVASFGTPDEHVEGTEDRTGGTLEQMSRSMLDCTHFVSNDSGPMHIASALGIPVLGIFAPTDPLTHLPLRRANIALALDRRCAPCEVKNHGYFASGSCRCVADITVREVTEGLVSIMKSRPVCARPIGGVPRTEGHSQEIVR